MYGIDHELERQQLSRKLPILMRQCPYSVCVSAKGSDDTYGPCIALFHNGPPHFHHDCLRLRRVESAAPRRPCDLPPHVDPSNRRSRGLRTVQLFMIGGDPEFAVIKAAVGKRNDVAM